MSSYHFIGYFLEYQTNQLFQIVILLAMQFYPSQRSAKVITKLLQKWNPDLPRELDKSPLKFQPLILPYLIDYLITHTRSFVAYLC